MKHNEMRNKNAIEVFHSVLKGNHSVEDIINDTHLCHVTVKNVGSLMSENRIFNAYKQLCEGKGRPSYNYKINPELYSVYMGEDKYSYVFIGINSYNDVVLRHDYIKRASLSFKENLRRAIKSIMGRPDYLCCINFFADCTDETAALLPKNIIRTDIEGLITNFVFPKDKTVLIEFKDKCYLSLYGHIHSTEAKIQDIEKVLHCDKTISYKNDIIYGIFDALKSATLIMMEEIISNIR
jgi:hypothetical protein